MRKSIDKLKNIQSLQIHMHNGQKYSTMGVGWFMSTFGDYILALLAWKNHIVAIFGDFLNCGQNA